MIQATFQISFGNLYNFVVINFVSKLIGCDTTKTNDHRVVYKLVKKNNFVLHGIPHVIINNDGYHILKALNLENYPKIWCKSKNCYNLSSTSEWLNKSVQHINKLNKFYKNSLGMIANIDLLA